MFGLLRAQIAIEKNSPWCRVRIFTSPNGRSCSLLNRSSLQTAPDPAEIPSASALLQLDQHGQITRTDFAENFDTKTWDIVQQCGSCGLFVVSESRREGHMRQVAFADGSFLPRNSQTGANAYGGIAAVTGARLERVDSSSSWERPLDAELEAIRLAFYALAGAYGMCERGHAKGDGQSKRWWIIATDCLEAVRDLTQTSALWNSGTSRALRNPHLVLYQTIIREQQAFEKRYDVSIGYWHIPRGDNVTANVLARQAARDLRDMGRSSQTPEGRQRLERHEGRRQHDRVVAIPVRLDDLNRNVEPAQPKQQGRSRYVRSFAILIKRQFAQRQD